MIMYIYFFEFVYLNIICKLVDVVVGGMNIYLK